ncbi:hypothetical protein LKV13_01180 [Borrelia sp. BU AG58]|uniref:hypothetical protein n=1 Tax=Borrelia sp. BU AG58 TaxID=2887345 RepID=UPI001E43DCB3|nr:hypothetical protein [Borrelia sp. BU AG58]UER67428.1 hypothetical protein LKV13_01180 [Borrelia sp. BU AG58]
MRKLALYFLFFSLVFVSLFAKGDFVVDDRQKELAIFYYEVGQRYIDVGKDKKGKRFQKKALELYPRLKEEVDFKIAIEEIDSRMSMEGEVKSIAFEDVKLDEIPGIVHGKIEINELTNAPKIEYVAEMARERNKEQAVKFQFNKFARALLLQDVNLLNSVMADEIKVLDKVGAKDVVISNLEDASAGVGKDELGYLSVDDFYDLKSLKIVKESDVYYSVRVKSRKNNITKNIPFWSNSQTLGFVKKGDGWVLSSIK